MKFALATLAALLSYPAHGFVVRPQSARAPWSSVGVVTDPTVEVTTPFPKIINPLEDLVTTEANIKTTRRTKPTIDPFNPDFESIPGVP